MKLPKHIALYRFCLLMVLLLAGHLYTFAQPYQIDISSPRRDLLIGDIASIKVKITFPADWKLQQQASRQMYGLLETVDSSRSIAHQEGDMLVVEEDFFVSAYDSGNYYFPAIEHYLTDASGRQVAATNDSLKLHFQLLEVDTTQAIKPIKDPVQVPRSFMEYLPWLIAGLAAILVALATFYWWRRRRRIILEERTALSYEDAMELLNRLQQEKLYEKGKIKLHYKQLSIVLRRYLSGVLGLVNYGLTTQDWVHITEVKLSRQEGDAVKEILQLADLVKFARLKPEDALSGAIVPKTKALISAVNTQKQEEEERRSKLPKK